jgi:hypothetical protein
MTAYFFLGTQQAGDACAPSPPAPASCSCLPLLPPDYLLLPLIPPSTILIKVIRTFSYYYPTIRPIISLFVSGNSEVTDQTGSGEIESLP